MENYNSFIITIISRPTSCEIVSHCFFWSKARKLAFFQDVSDRIEKEPFTSPIVQALEQGGLSVVRRDWRENITEDLKEGRVPWFFDAFCTTVTDMNALISWK